MMKRAIIGMLSVAALMLTGTAQAALVFQMDFNDADGNPSLLDRGTTGVTGSFTGNATNSTSVPPVNGGGYSGSFDGASGAADFGDINALDNLTTMTITAWIRMDTAGEGGKGGIVTKRNDNLSGFETSYDSSDNNLLLAVKSVPSADGGGPIGFGAWKFIAMTYDSVAKDATFYTGDGATLSAADTVTLDKGATGSNAFSLLIGNNLGDSRTFDGLIDNLRIYDSVENAASLTNIMQFDDVTFVWDGGGVDGKWSTAANWDPDGSPSESAWDTFIFGGTSQLNSSNDMGGATGGYNVSDITFDATAGTFTLTDNGDGFDMLGKSAGADPDDIALILNQSANTQTINLDLFHRTDHNAGLVFSNSAAGTITVSGQILDQSGTTDPVTIRGNGTVIFSGANTYADGTDILGGTLDFLDNDALGTGRIDLGGGGVLQFGVDALDLSEAVRAQNDGGNRIIRLDLAGTTTGTLSGTLDIRRNTAGEFDIEVGTDDTLTVSGDIVNQVAGGAGLTKEGDGTLTLTAANTYSGATTVSNGTLKLQGNAFFTKNRAYSIASGAVLNIDGGASIAVGTTGISGDGTLRVTGGTLSAGANGRDLTLSLGSDALIDIEAGGEIVNGGWQAIDWNSNLADITVDGTLDVWDGADVKVDALTGSGTITKGQGFSDVILQVGVDNGSGTFSGTIGEGGGAGATVIDLTKSGSGTQTLASANTYKGSTIINDGTLKGTALTAFGAANNTRTITVTSATLDVNKIGMYGSHASIRVPSLVINTGGIASNTGGNNPLNNVTLNGGTLTASASNGSTWRSWAINGTITSTGTSTIEPGTAPAPGILLDSNGPHETTVDVQSGTLTISTPIINGHSGGYQPTALTKTGAGTLSLTGANTYSGTTTVSAGTLGGSGSIAGLVTVSSGGHVAPGVGVGTLTMAGGLTLSDGSILDMEVDMAAGTSDTILVTGGDIDGAPSADGVTVNVTVSGALAQGTHVLMDWTAADTEDSVDLTDFSLGTAAGSIANGSLQITGQQLLLTVTTGMMISIR